MAQQWFKFYVDMLGDPKWRRVAKLSGATISEVISVFLAVLTEYRTSLDVEQNDDNDGCNVNSNASNVNSNVSVTLKSYEYKIERIADTLDLPDEKVAAILEAMEGRVLTNGAPSNWDKRQSELTRVLRRLFCLSQAHPAACSLLER